MFQGTKVRSRERKFQGARVAGNESYIAWNFRSRERKFLGAKIPVTNNKAYVRDRIIINVREQGMKVTFVPGNESSLVRKFHESY